MAFLLPMAELVFEGVAMGTGSAMANDAWSHFKPEIEDYATEKIGQKLGSHIREHPDGFLANTLESTAYYIHHKTPRPHSNRHARRGYKKV